MPTVSELIESRSFQFDLQKKSMATMEFFVDLPPLAALQAPGIPVTGLAGQFPDDPSLICDRVAASYWPGSNNNSRVSVFFSRDRTMRVLPDIDKLQPGYREFGVDFRPIKTPLPVQVYHEAGMEIQTRENGEPVYTAVNVWDIQEKNVDEVFTVYQVQVVVDSLTMKDIDLISEQNNKLHFIGDRWYLFTAGAIRRRDSAKYETTYSWTFDPGIPDIPFNPEGDVIPPAGFASVLGLFPYGDKNKKWTRPPYETLLVSTSTKFDPNTRTQYKHTFRTFLPYAKDDYGFKQLPGSPL